jgi:glycosyltransferase involved in cell wall biosynthesis
MTANKPARILVDGRELLPDRKTGIGRVLDGLLDALNFSNLDIRIILACWYFPHKFIGSDKINHEKIPRSFLMSERTLSKMTKVDISLFISPYPKLPLFGTDCHAINMIHDVLDLTHPLYEKRFKTFFDRFRLKRALKEADLTWYVSEWSLKETKTHVGFTGNNPKVRYNGIDEIFTPNKDKNEKRVLVKYGLEPGYVLVIGNGLPHKNLGVILDITQQVKRHFVFLGVSTKNQAYWKSRHPGENAVWISNVTDEDLPSIIRGSFCLVQPSTMEGYGYPPLEAMACGVPAVVSNIPVLRETTGSNALSADPKNPKDWIESVRTLENQRVRQEQIKKGLKWIEPLQGPKGWQKHVSDIEKLIGAR